VGLGEVSAIAAALAARFPVARATRGLPAQRACAIVAGVPPADPDLALRQAAVARARELAQAYDDLVPLARLREGFPYDERRVSFGSFQKGIHRSRAQRGAAALTVTTSFKDPYADAFDEAGGSFMYAYRSGPVDQADNRALRTAFEMQTPIVYFRALAPGQYLVVAPMFVTADDPGTRTVVLEPGLPVQDMQPGGLVSGPDVRAYATREARHRLHQQRFKLDVMRAYRHRCAICTLRERELVQAAHIVPDIEPEGIAAVVNGLALCAIHHLAFDRNLLGIDPDGVVHIADRLLREIDGPMLRMGLQGFHGTPIALPRRPEERPDTLRLRTRFERFVSAAA
jgi:putative restriction endonuclease